jgi:hypothetical protein
MEEVDMGYSMAALQDKILDIYPEIQRRGLSARLTLDEDTQQCLVILKEGTREFTAALKKEDTEKGIDATPYDTFGRHVKELINRF